MRFVNRACRARLPGGPFLSASGRNSRTRGLARHQACAAWALPPSPPVNVHREPHGTSLIEVLVATAIVVTAVSTLASLTSLALRMVGAGRERTLAVVAAQSRLEDLQSSLTPPPASPADTLDRDVPGWSERIDPFGRVAGRDPSFAGTVFVRRWHVEAVAGVPGLLALRVRAGPCAPDRAPGGSCAALRNGVTVSGLRSEAVW